MPEPPRLRVPTQESLLFDLVQRLDRFRAGRIGIHLHLSNLCNAYKRDRYLRIATESFSAYISGFEGHLFPLENGDLFFLAKDTTTPLLEAAVGRIQLLFSQDPLLQMQPLRGGTAFATWYFLEDDYDQLLIDVRNILKTAEKKIEAESIAPPDPPKIREEIRPEILSRLEQSLENVDVTNLARRQPVCTLADEKNPLPLFEEIFISMEDMESVVTPGINLLSNTWLFRYLTQTLDKRIMLMLVRDGVSTNLPFSLNLNVATVLTPEFAKFESIITPQLRGRLVVEMNKLDVFADMGAFLFARDYLHDHGFRLCLDGLTHHTLPYYDRAKLGFDLIKLYWTPNALDDMLPSMVPQIRNIVMDTGQAHTILCRCDDERAVRTGQELGIVMFQGRYVDRLLFLSKGRVGYRL